MQNRNQHEHRLDFNGSYGSMAAFLLPLLFALGLALLITHEIDAAVSHEWRMIPGLSQLNDRIGMNIFIFLHVPVLWVLIWLIGHRSSMIRRRTQLGVDIFLIAHTFIHFGFSGHEFYGFSGPLSNLFIIGGGLVGALHLVLLSLGRNNKRTASP